MLVKELVDMLQCPPPEPWRPRVRERVSESERRSGRCMTWMETESERESERVIAGVRSREMHDAWMETESEREREQEHGIQRESERDARHTHRSFHVLLPCFFSIMSIETGDHR